MHAAGQYKLMRHTRRIPSRRPFPYTSPLRSERLYCSPTKLRRHDSNHATEAPPVSPEGLPACPPPLPMPCGRHRARQLRAGRAPEASCSGLSTSVQGRRRRVTAPALVRGGGMRWGAQDRYRAAHEERRREREEPAVRVSRREHQQQHRKERRAPHRMLHSPGRLRHRRRRARPRRAWATEVAHPVEKDLRRTAALISILIRSIKGGYG